MSEPAVERKLAAILAADVVSYSRLMGRDEVGTLRSLKAVRRDLFDPAIAAHHGRIVKTTGDGLLVEFASVVDAVACAVAVQRGMVARNADVAEDRRIVFRIGINVGDIIMDGGDIFGDGVNIAARLEALCEPGGLCISRTANDQIRDKLSLAFADMGEQTVKNIARAVGVYGLRAADIAALPEEPLPPPSEAAAAPPPAETRPEPTRASSRMGLVAVGAVAVAVVLGGAAWWLTRGEAPKPAAAAAVVPPPPAPVSTADRRLSVVVLPIENVSGDPAQDAIAATLTAELTARLSANRPLLVTPATTAAGYRGKSVSLPAVGRELDVHFALTGSVRTDGGRLVLTQTLQDIATDRPVWSERFDRPANLDADGRIGLVATISGRVWQSAMDAEVARAKRERPGKLDARDLLYASWASELQAATRENNVAGLALLDQAIALDPELTEAMQAAAWRRVNALLNEWSTDRKADFATVNRAVDKLNALKSQDVGVIWLKANLKRAEGDRVQSVVLYRRVIELDARNWNVHREIGIALQQEGQFAESLDSLKRARQYWPSHINASSLDRQTATTLLALGRFDEAATMARRAVVTVPEGTGLSAELGWITLIAAESMAGQQAQAAKDLKTHLASAKRFRTVSDVTKTSWVNVVKNMADGLRKAGMPE